MRNTLKRPTGKQRTNDPYASDKQCSTNQLRFQKGIGPVRASRAQLAAVPVALKFITNSLVFDCESGKFSSHGHREPGGPQVPSRHRFGQNPFELIYCAAPGVPGFHQRPASGGFLALQHRRP
jgi:hypothetical protein